MSYISKFKRDVAYSNVDINQALSIITTAGITPDTPNDILAEVSSDGVTHENEGCAVFWANDEKTQVKIQPGTVIMPDGSYIIIADEILTVSSTNTHYIYIYQDLALHNTPVCSEALPDDSSLYVLLATAQNGVITDRRKVAVSKIDNFGVNPIIEMSHSFTLPKESLPAGTALSSIPVDSKYSKVLFYESRYKFFGVFNLLTGVFDYGYYDGGRNLRQNQALLPTASILNNFYMKYVDGNLWFCSIEDLRPYIDITFDFTLTIF